MRVAGSILTLICGIVVLVGVFLPWFNTPIGAASGWNFIDAYGISNATQPFMVLLSGILLIVFILPCFILSMVTGGAKVATILLSTLASVVALVAIGGAVWYIIDVITATVPNLQLSIIGYGVYVSAAAALVGLIFAFVTLSASIGARPRPRYMTPQPAPAAAPTVAAAPPPPPPSPITTTPPPPPPPPVPETVVEVAEEPAPTVAEEAPLAEQPVTTPAEETVTAIAEPAEAPAPEKPKKERKPVVEKVAEAPSAKPEGIDESALPMVQQPWESSADFKARKRRKMRL